jgi:hypothetical protein
MHQLLRPLMFGIALALLAATAAPAQETDAADLAFWQSIQNSTNPAEYRAYLEAFPNGKFAALARIRAAAPPAAGTPGASTAAPAAAGSPGSSTAAAPAAAAPGGDVGQGERIVLNPPTARVGQQIAVTCQDFPQPTGYDKLIVVAAGTPDVDPDTAAGAGIKVLWKDYAANCNKYKMMAGPFAPGAYEVRFMTRLYNNDQRQEIATRTPFTVR